MFIVNKFEVLIHQLNSKLEIILNTTAANEHVPDVERQTDVIK